MPDQDEVWGWGEEDDLEDATRAYREACEREKRLEFARMYSAGPLKLRRLKGVTS